MPSSERREPVSVRRCGPQSVTDRLNTRLRGKTTLKDYTHSSSDPFTQLNLPLTRMTSRAFNEYHVLINNKIAL